MSTDEPEVVVSVCIDPEAPPEVREALAEVARAAVRHHERELAAMTPEQRAAHDERQRAGRERLERIRRRARLDERGEP